MNKKDELKINLKDLEKNFQNPYKNGQDLKLSFQNKKDNYSAEIDKLKEDLNNKHSETDLEHKKRLFDWIINICNKFLIGVSLVFCMFMFEIKNSFLEFSTPTIFLTLIIFIFYKILSHFYPNLPKKIQIFKPSEDEINILKPIIFLFSIITLYKIIDIRNLKEIIYLPTIIITLITSTTATIIGLPAIVAMSIFRSKKKKKK
jgi:ABC-type phosphate transport system permease subunit